MRMNEKAAIAMAMIAMPIAPYVIELAELMDFWRSDTSDVSAVISDEMAEVSSFVAVFSRASVRMSPISFVVTFIGSDV